MHDVRLEKQILMTKNNLEKYNEKVRRKLENILSSI